MAQGFAEAFGQEKVEVYSAGSRPSSQIDPLVIEGMKETDRLPFGVWNVPFDGLFCQDGGAGLFTTHRDKIIHLN